MPVHALATELSPIRGISSSIGSEVRRHDSRMATDRMPNDRAAFEADVIHRQLGALTDASRQRHRLVPGSREYEAALAIEERLAQHIWELATDFRPSTRQSTPRQAPRPSGGDTQGPPPTGSATSSKLRP